MADVSLSPGLSGTLTITPVDTTGKTTCYIKGTIVVTSNNTSIFTVTKGTTEDVWTVKAIGWGVASGSIKMNSHDGTFRTKTFYVDVTCNEIADIRIVFTK